MNNAESVGKGTQFCCDLISRFGAGFGCMEVNGSGFFCFFNLPALGGQNRKPWLIKICCLLHNPQNIRGGPQKASRQATQ